MIDAQESLSSLIKRLEKYVYNLTAVRQQNTLSRAERNIVQDITQNISLARAQTEFSQGDEDIIARIKGFRLAIEELRAVIDGILLASNHDLVSIIEVTQLTAMAEVCIDRVNLLIKET
jgi:hypothetical protein